MYRMGYIHMDSATSGADDQQECLWVMTSVVEMLDRQTGMLRDERDATAWILHPVAFHQCWARA